MEEDFIGKDVSIVVVFADYMMGSGAIPKSYHGIVKEIDDTYLKLTVTEKRNIYKDVIINKKFIAYIEEL